MQNKSNQTKEVDRGKLSVQSSAILEILANRGIIGDQQIDDEKIRQAEKIKKRNMYHNTQLLLQNYRDITWMLECFPANIAEELNQPMHDLDTLLGFVSSEIDMDNHRLVNKLKSAQKSRILLNRFNEALTILKQKPGNGKLMYDIIYHTYIIPEKLSHSDLIYRLDISTRHYYRLRTQAVNILSLRLWSAPTGELDSWLDVLTILENI